MSSLTRSKSGHKVVGTFGKGLEGSVAINFDVSGGANCDPACPHHPQSTAEEATQACYAVRTENRPDRIQLKNKLQRHGRMPAWLICGRALAEVSQLVCRGKSIPWIRISTNGSVPQPSEARQSQLFRKMFRKLLQYVRDAGIPVHLPVETYAKARYYRALVGDLVTVRESAAGVLRFIRTKGPVSVVVGAPGTKREERVQQARTVARLRREATGRKTIVCPAILNSWASHPVKKNAIPSNPRAKCGACVACSRPDVDIVYPLH